MADHTSTIVQSIPDCDLCKQNGQAVPAYADAALTLGSWGYVCIEHFNLFGKGLGMGRGQRLLLDPAAEKRVLSEDEDDADPVVDTVYKSKQHEGAAKYLAELIASRDRAHDTLPLSDRERTSWNRRIAKASIVMNVEAMKATKR